MVVYRTGLYFLNKQVENKKLLLGILSKVSLAENNVTF